MTHLSTSDAVGPRLTIGVPVRNGARFLPACLDSVRRQTVRDIRIIVADNASDDETPAIVQEAVAQDDRVSYVRHPRDIGLTGNFNALVDLATTPLFKWVAADDVIEPTLVEACLRALDAGPEATVAACRLEVIDSHGDPFRVAPGGRLVSDEGFDIPIRAPVAAAVGASDPRIRFKTVLRGMLGLEISTYIFGVMRTAALRRTHGLGSYPGSDKVLLSELVLQGPFIEVPDILWSCRIHPSHIGGASAADVRRAMRPSWSTRVESMRLDQLRGYLGAVSRSGLGAKAKLDCLAALVGRGLVATAGGGD